MKLNATSCNIAMLLGLFENATALLSDPSKIYYFWRVSNAPINIFEESEQDIQFATSILWQQKSK
ncbi:hypothetical protein P3S67_013538 [Capsicum chacoense]